MGKRKVSVWAYECERCGHKWIQRELGSDQPKVCPNRKCKSPYWDRPRRDATRAPVKGGMGKVKPAK